MSPFHVFLLVALIGAIVVVGYWTVVDCADAELVRLSGVVTGKAVGTREVERTVVTGGCPLCPGSKPETRVVLVSEEVYYLLVELEEGGEKRLQRFAVEEGLYRRVEPGTRVEVRYLRGKLRGTPCTLPQLVFPEG
ncbi:MAG: hypothetical protein ABDI20_02445 [Candidatus Bipolaricaulaceae bacterium]